ncbi:hypothetical protein PROFUN_00357 [Planoprotostelium fungivorum]|uniref:Uncharacterized protein n=1 Tax=Planoprotostelium fungivorum TaxID=1890364 RepID=A0A2P6NY73_9EUKA|nr:hypothetical protein PROFUN_00357 [Planoprotostelium fungivorum]
MSHKRKHPDMEIMEEWQPPKRQHLDVEEPMIPSEPNENEGEERRIEVIEGDPLLVTPSVPTSEPNNQQLIAFRPTKAIVMEPFIRNQREMLRHLLTRMDRQSIIDMMNERQLLPANVATFIELLDQELLHYKKNNKKSESRVEEIKEDEATQPRIEDIDDYHDEGMVLD